MPYTPETGDEGIQLVLAALRDFIQEQTDITDLLGAGADSVLPEGFLTTSIAMPIIEIAIIGDGKSQVGSGVQLLRLMLWVMDRDRGYYAIERIINRLRNALNQGQVTREYFTFPPEEPVRVLSTNATGTTASASFPRWKSEGRGLYVFMELFGLPVSE
jgi:hypothetical protein